MVDKPNNHFKKQWLLPSLFLIGIIIVLFGYLIWLVFPLLERWVSHVEQFYNQKIQPETLQKSRWLLLPAAFFGGLLSSISPCILALLPLNLSYIGTLENRSKIESIRNALAFVFGAVFILSLMGLFSAFAGALMVEYRGYVQVAVGIFAIGMGLVVTDIIHLTLPQVVHSIPKGSAPFLVGIVFTLISSPCSSPVLFTMLALASETESPVLSALTMASYAIGYTMVLFLASVLTGFSRQVGRLKQYGKQMTLLSGGFLIIVGLYYLISGFLWSQ